MSRSLLCRCLAVASSFIFLASTSNAANFADQVVSYTHGNGNTLYSNPSAALAAPDGLTGENAAALPSFGFGAVLSPFNSAYQNDEIVQLGEGGSITLRLGIAVHVGAGMEFGVIENVNLFDPAYPSGTTSSPAAVFSQSAAQVEISQDGITFVGLGGASATNVLFNMPANYYLNAGAFDELAPTSPVVADFGKPFTPAGGLAAFDGKASYADVLAVFDGSAGGTWLDASASGLTSIRFIRLSVPDDGDNSTANTLEVDSILTNSALVPEPVSLSLMGGLLAMSRRSRT